MRLFNVWLDKETGKFVVGAEPPEVSRTHPNGTDREVVEMALCTQSTPWLHLGKLSVSNSISLDQILELLKLAPKLHNVDIPETKQYAEALARYSAFAVPTSNA